MNYTPEEAKRLSRAALESALKGAVWVQNADGNYETVLPAKAGYLRNLPALASVAHKENGPVLAYEQLDGASAHRLVVGKEAADAIHTPTMLRFDERALPSHSRNVTHSLLALLNGRWSEERSATNATLQHSTMPQGDLARGVYAYLREALRQKPEELAQWNGGNIVYVDTKKHEVHFHLGSDLTQALFGDSIAQLMQYRKGMDSSHFSRPAPAVTAASEFSTLRDALPVPGTYISQPQEHSRVRPPKQLNLPF